MFFKQQNGKRQLTPNNSDLSFMDRRAFLKTVGTGVASLSLSSCFAADSGHRTSRPNIILIMVDDMGFSDIGCYGGEIHTPNLDRLAAQGLRFKQFYNTGRCCPTRASLMTGLYPHQVGIGHMTEGPEGPSPLQDEPYQGYLNQRCVTIAEVLQKAGYHTLMTGKWHLGYHRKECWPLQRGFDKYFGIISGACDYFRPTKPRGLTYMNEPFEVSSNFYVTDAFTDYACRFIEESIQQKDKPFFLYLAYNAPHWPLEAKTEDLKKYEGTYKIGWNQISKQRLARQQAMGLIDPKWIPAKHEGPEWDSLSEEQKKIMDLRMAAYAACVDSIDQNVGKLIDKLKSLNKYEDTIIFFLSDNGACQEGGILGSGSEKAIRDPMSTRGTDGPSCGRAWANASNTPFRLYKHFVHEGGMSAPMIVHWPKGVPKDKLGSFVEPFGYLQDLMPTCLELAEAQYPKKRNDRTIPPMVGTSLIPLIKGSNKAIHIEPVFWEHEGNRAMRDGKWKLVWARKGPWELYDLEADRTEMHNLVKDMPNRAADMQRAWESWARRTGIQFQTSFSYYKMFDDYKKNQNPKK
ncbi:MAG: arylsulfatase [Sedimentisphaerales bacterium]|nr:arylsulfatase [Sedimentisphaerales bacterium]